MINTSEIQLEGYNIFNCVNFTGRRFIIYVNDLLKPTIIDDVDLVYSGTVFVSLKINDTEEVTLGCLYRSPNINQEHNNKVNQVMVTQSKTIRKCYW